MELSNGHQVAESTRLRKEITRLSGAVTWCLAELRLLEENGERVASEDLCRLEDLSDELHLRTQELCAFYRQ